MPATTMVQMVDHKLTRAGRKGSACNHQRTSKNKKPK